MATAEYFDMSPSDIAYQRNLAAEQVVAQLVDIGAITKEVGEKFLEDYSFVSVRQNSITDRIRRILFKPDSTKDSYLFPLVKVL